MHGTEMRDQNEARAQDITAVWERLSAGWAYGGTGQKQNDDLTKAKSLTS